MHTSAESVWCRQRPKADVWLGGATVQIRQSGVNYRKFLACDLFMWNKKSVVGSECQRAAQEWHEPAATDVLHRMCAALLRPAVTHQTAGQAWGKYEVTGPPLASPSHTHTHRLLHPRQRPLTATVSKWISRSGREMRTCGGLVTGWQRVINMMDGCSGGSWLLFNALRDYLEDDNQSVWLVKHSPVVSVLLWPLSQGTCT